MSKLPIYVIIIGEVNMEIAIDDIKLNYIDEGVGEETVLLLHGWGANIQTMVPISNLLKDRYRVISLDLPGFGMSEEPKRVFNSYDYMDLVLKFLDAINIDKAIFIGHSYGGKLSTMISSLHKDRVIKTVIIDASGLIPKRGLDYYLKVYSFKALRSIYTMLPLADKEERSKSFYKKFGSDDYRASEGIMRKIMVTVVNENIRPLMKDIECETLLIWGDQDDATPLYMGEIFNKEIKNSGLVVLKGAGHYSYIDDYGTFSAVINSFL